MGYCGCVSQTLCAVPHLNVLAEEVGIETQPVPGYVQSALQQDVSKESTRVH